MRQAILGLGARTALGYGAVASAAAVRAGVSGCLTSSYLVDRSGAAMVLATAPGLAAAGDHVNRLVTLLNAALTDLACGLPALRTAQPLPLLLALPAPRPGLPPDYCERLTAALCANDEANAWRFACPLIEWFPFGHAAAILALQRAKDWFAAGHPLVLVAAVDSWLQVDTLEWLDASARLHGPALPWGFIPGEAAAACLLGAAAEPSAAGLPPLAQITALASATEPHPLGSQKPCVAAGLTNALHGVLDQRPADAAPVATVWCDLNGERHRTDEIGFALTRIAHALREPGHLGAPADCWGDVGAASGLLLLLPPVAAALRGYARGREALLWCSSDGPTRGALLLDTGATEELP